MSAFVRKKSVLQFCCVGILGSFLLLASLQSITADFSAGRWQSLAVRVVLMGVVSLLVGLRMGRLLARESRLCPAYLVLIVLFCGSLFFPLVTHTSYLGQSVTRTWKQLEHVRKKKGGTTLDKLRLFPAAYEKYWQDHSILPKALIHLNAMIKVYLFHVSPNPTIALGKNGFYFEGFGARKVEKGLVESFDNIADYLGMIPFSSLELWKWKQTLEERSYWLQKRGVKYVFVLAPTKGLVYPEYLPGSLQGRAGGTRRYEQLSRYLQEHARIHFVDVLPPLLQAKKERSYPLLFYKTDFHWNFYGSLVAYEAIVRAMQRFFPQYHLQPVTLDDFEMKIDTHWAHHRFMNMIGLPESLHRHEHYLTMVPKPGTPLYGLPDLPKKGIHDVYPPLGKIRNAKGESMQIRMVHNPEASLDSILLLGDSFMEKCVYYFSANAREVWNYRTVVNFPYKIFLYRTPTIAVQEILNMFLLRPPPENPSGIRQEYLADRFATRRNEGAVLHPGKFGDTKDGAIKITCPEQSGQAGMIARIRLFSSDRKIVSLFLETAENRQIPWTEEHLEKGENVLYVSIAPEENLRALLLRDRKGKALSSVQVQQVDCLEEVRR